MDDPGPAESAGSPVPSASQSRTRAATLVSPPAVPFRQVAATTSGAMSTANIVRATRRATVTVNVPCPNPTTSPYGPAPPVFSTQAGSKKASTRPRRASRSRGPSFGPRPGRPGAVAALGWHRATGGPGGTAGGGSPSRHRGADRQPYRFSLVAWSRSTTLTRGRSGDFAVRLYGRRLRGLPAGPFLIPYRVPQGCERGPGTAPRPDFHPTATRCHRRTAAPGSGSGCRWRTGRPA